MVSQAESQIPKWMEEALQELFISGSERLFKENNDINIGMRVKFTACEPTGGQYRDFVAVDWHRSAGFGIG